MAAVLEKVQSLKEQNSEVRQQFSKLEQRQAEHLRELIQQLKRASTDDDQEFARVFDCAVNLLNRTDVELAKTFGVSHPTIGRWARGEYAPYSLARRAVFDSLIGLAEADVRGAQSRSRGQAVPTLRRIR